MLIRIFREISVSSVNQCSRRTLQLENLLQEGPIQEIVELAAGGQAADVICGVTMGRDSASQIISLRLNQVTDEFIGRT